MRRTLELSPLADEFGVKLTGEVDLATSRQLSEALAKMPTDSTVHLELSELTFLDSSGLSAILSFARSLKRPAPLVILNPSDEVERLFEITGLEDHPNIEVRNTRNKPSGAARSAVLTAAPARPPRDAQVRLELLAKETSR